MINKDYSCSSIYNSVEELNLTQNSTYIYSYSPERRSKVVDQLKSSNSQIDFWGLTYDNDNLVFRGITYSLRSTESLKELLKGCKDIIYIDVTGMNTRVAAALLRVMLMDGCDIDIRILYIEPKNYNIGRFKSAGVFNDLAESTEGIYPLPGFATIIPNNNANIQFVAFLGFEGGRFTQIVESEQPMHSTIIPIVGVPGFRVEYPFVALWGNRQALETTKSWGDIRYVAANSIVDSYKILSSLHKQGDNKHIKIAPIGTKPHTIASILFAIKHPRSVELIYDNPIRKVERTEGVGLITETFINKLLEL